MVSVFPIELPLIGDLIESAFPTWCIDETEKRIFGTETCFDGTPNGVFSPRYFSKEFSGADPALGGYPTNIDIQYAFEFAAPYLGQACAGSPHHCAEDFDGTTQNCKKCPKVKTDNDSGPNGPGHIPPHIALASVTNYYNKIISDPSVEVGTALADAFDYDQNACRILPNVLLSMIRESYPRDPDTGDAYYPPPFSVAGGAFPLEFVNLAGESCEKEKAKHADAGALDCFEQHSGDVSLYPDDLMVGHGSPHYCTQEGKDADVNNDWCPYIFFGPNRGKYRHPHIAFAAVETYLAHLVMPETCGTTWDDSNYPAAVDTTVAFSYMENNPDGFMPSQPLVEDGMWIWPGPLGGKKKPVKGFFTFDLYVAKEPEPPLFGSSYCTYAPDTSCYSSGWPACCGDDSIHCPDMQPDCEVKSCETIAEMVCGPSSDLSELCDLVQRAGLADDLSEGSWTVFAPMNGAFEDVENFSKDTLKRLLLFHVVAGDELYSSNLKCKSPQNLITMANGFDSRTLCNNGRPTYIKGRSNSNTNPPIIVEANLDACNGVVHVISDVMLYKEYG